MVWVYDRTTGRRFQVPESVAASMVRQDRYKYTTGNNAQVAQQAANAGRTEQEVQEIAEAWTIPKNTPGFSFERPPTVPGMVTHYGVFPGIGIPGVAYATGASTDRAPWDADDLTPEEQRQIESIIGTIKSQAQDPDGGQWYSIDPQTGQIVHARMGMMNIEQGYKDMSDKVIGAVQNWYRDYLPGFDDPEAGGVELPDPFGGYGGGGGGYAGPVYVKPDRRVVEDSVKAMLIATTGEADAERVDKLVDVWYTGHKASWDVRQSGGEDVDPNAAVLEQIRGYDDYKRIHSNRSDQEDEMTWISSRRQRIGQLGMTGQDADERAIALAQVGTNVNDIDVSKAQTGLGNVDTGLRGKLKNAATMVARSL